MNPFSRSAHLPDDATAAEIDAAMALDDDSPLCCVCGDDCESRKYALPEGHLCDWHGTLLGLAVVDGIVPLSAGRVG